MKIATTILLSCVQLVSAFGKNCAIDQSQIYLNHLRRITDDPFSSIADNDNAVKHVNRGKCALNCLSQLPTLRQSVTISSPSIAAENTVDAIIKTKTKKHKRKRKHRRAATDDADLKIAIVGDFGVGDAPFRVLKMVRKWGADITVMTGDYDYVDSPEAFMGLVARATAAVAVDGGSESAYENDDEFAFIGVVGNHDILEWYGRDGYRDRFTE
ncbi:hypothetical protein HK100_010299, partial [Physocladia obscura]